MALSIVCPECSTESIRPHAYQDPVQPEITHRGYCPDCGWIHLTPGQAHYWRVRPQKLARWLANGLGLTPRFNTEPVIDGVLWRLGELEHRRHRRTLFFGRRLQSAAGEINAKLSQLVAPGAEVIITPGDINLLRSTVLADRVIVPLRAIAHIRKSCVVIENLDAYLLAPTPIDESTETSLRLMHTKRVALIDGKQCKLSPQVYLFLKILQDTDGDEVHKHHIAEGLNIEATTFRTADIFKRHKRVYEIFVGKDGKGNYWLQPEFLILEGR